MRVLIVGGVAGGATAAARLRRLNEDAEIVMFEKGNYISFANCGMPYYIGDVIEEADELLLQTPQSFHDRFNVDVRTDCQVTGVDNTNKKVTVKLGDNVIEEEYDKLILAPGAVPVVPKIPGIESVRFFTLRDMDDTLKIKEYVDGHDIKSAVVIGGGFIGLETAENLHRLGIDVTVIENRDQVLYNFDEEMVCDIQNYLRSKDIKLLLGVSVEEVSGQKEIVLKTSCGDIKTDLLIAATGVKPDTEFIENTDIKMTDRGAIIVNDVMQTSDPDVYAVGDAIETVSAVTGDRLSCMLAGPANKQARVAADHIGGVDNKYTGAQGSAIIKLFDMAAASTGLTEREAKAKGLDYDKVYTYSPSHASYYPGAKSMSVKTIYDKKTGKILGAQIVGFEGVDKRCDLLAAAVRLGLNADQLCEMELCYAPPFSSAKDPVNIAGYVIQNTENGLVKNFFWDEVDSLPRDGSVSLVDVRTPKEFERGAIPGFKNIPLDEIRANLDLLDKDKPVYVNCGIGLRSYNACRILTGHGYDCYSLSGGYRLYDSVKRNEEEKKRQC